jgi:hypothetical protein
MRYLDATPRSSVSARVEQARIFGDWLHNLAYTRLLRLRYTPKLRGSVVATRHSIWNLKLTPTRKNGQRSVVGQSKEGDVYTCTSEARSAAKELVTGSSFFWSPLSAGALIRPVVRRRAALNLGQAVG